tara:strand:+ start:544 stop:711 length:168 start_codon:yes stop_codon:yes gene_type:complete
MKVGDLVREKGDIDVALVLEKEKHHITLMWLNDGHVDRQPKIYMGPWEVVSRESR